MICIDFQGGAHGNFLEFVCNTVANITTGSPFNKLGAAHQKTYIGEKLFVAEHFSFWPTPLLSNKVITVRIEINDLLPLQQVSLLRAGDFNYHSNDLHINTFKKLNNIHYRPLLDRILKGYFDDYIKTSYSAVKDPSWPPVNNNQDYKALPQWIQDECEFVHGIKYLELSKEKPDCPKYILRDAFKIGFQKPYEHGFIVKQNAIVYPADADVFVFPFSAFYHTENFLSLIERIALWAKIPYTNQDHIAKLHQDFLSRQIFKDSKIKCDKVIEQIVNGQTKELPSLTLLEQAYVNAHLSQDWFTE
jgi:hypothetical protein